MLLTTSKEQADANQVKQILQNITNGAHLAALLDPADGNQGSGMLSEDIGTRQQLQNITRTNEQPGGAPGSCKRQPGRRDIIGGHKATAGAEVIKKICAAFMINQEKALKIAFFCFFKMQKSYKNYRKTHIFLFFVKFINLSSKAARLMDP